MFELIEVRNYDTHHRYGTDWHTDYIIKCDQNLSIDEVIKKLQEIGKEPCGECKLKYFQKEQEMILETIMY